MLAFFDRYRYSLILLRELVITEFKLRYQGSALGYLWSLLRPLMLFAILYVVFVHFFKLGDDIPHYPVYLLLGIVLWNFFSEITNNGVSAIVSRSDLIRKINFPKYVIILAGAFSALVNLLFNLVVVGIFIILNDVNIGWSALLSIFYIGEILLFAMALAFILSALFVRFRDINYIWEVIMQAMFYATPIIYPLTLVIEDWPWLAKLMLLNPVAQAMQDIRFHTITAETITLDKLDPRLFLQLVPFLIVAVTLIVAMIYFKKRSPYFAEEV